MSSKSTFASSLNLYGRSVRGYVGVCLRTYSLWQCPAIERETRFTWLDLSNPEHLYISGASETQSQKQALELKRLQSMYAIFSFLPRKFALVCTAQTNTCSCCAHRRFAESVMEGVEAKAELAACDAELQARTAQTSTAPRIGGLEARR